MRELCAVGCMLVLAALGPAACGRANSGVPQADDEGPALVAIDRARTGSLTDEWVFVGEVRPLMEAKLAAGAAGEVRRVQVREGDRVAKGSLLVALDASLAKAKMAAARASRSQAREEAEQARRDLQRAKRLGGEVLPEAEIERDESRATALDSREESLRATAHEAKELVRLHRVDAPFDGVVSSRHVDPGDWVDPGDPVVDLVAADRVEVLVNASPKLAHHVDQGDRASIRMDDRRIGAEVLGVVPALDPVTRTIKLRLVPDDEQSWLLPGAAVDVAFAIERSGEGVIVSRDALVTGAVDTRVIRVVDGKAKPVVVQVIATADDQALVKAEELSAGDQVVVRGNERLRPGQPVKISEREGEH